MLRIILHTLLSRFLLLLVLIVFFIPMVIALCLPARWRLDNRVVFYVTQALYWCVLKCTLIPIRYEGLENVPDGPVVVAANHQSSLDIPLVGNILRGYPHLWLARSELLDTWWLRILLGKFAVVVEVGSPMKAMRSLLQVIGL